MKDHRKQTVKKIIYFLVFFGITMTIPAFADIYMYVGDDGVLHFTNVPTTAKYKLYLKERPQKSPKAYTTKQYDLYISKASQLHGVSFPLLKAVIKAESDFNPRAVSKKGAKGLMQLMPENIKAFKIKDPFDPWENIMVGTRYLKQLLDRYDGKVPLTLAAYNAGPRAVDQYNRIPPFKETEDYVRKVMRYYYAFKE